eukprot:TRINITY_DN33357_c0_g1_i1.p1 TRINITY_DN33357_c0_g1~~TRINITY_DN33357_c0_g1_i1.p1  ORF type:complete len:181 (+),score=49.02 TRINITY_DN33357_c0_g1_i1:37-579(+)
MLHRECVEQWSQLSPAVAQTNDGFEDDMSVTHNEEKVRQLERSIRQREEELHRDIVRLDRARRVLFCQESKSAFQRNAEEEECRFEEFLQRKMEASVAALEAKLEPARCRCVEVVEQTERQATELRTLRSRIEGWLSDLEEAAQSCEENIHLSVQSALDEYVKKRREKLQLEMRLLMDGS